VAQSPSPEADAQLEAALAYVELMNAAPPGILETCMPASGDPPELEGIVATVQCLSDGAIVLYVRFVGEDDLEVAYDYFGSLTGLSPDTGSACRDGAFEGEYTAADGSPGGRLICQLGPDGPMAMWTDPRAVVLGIVQVLGGEDFSALEEAWSSAQLASAEGAPATVASPTSEATESVAGTRLSQWATSATASSQYGSDPWSAMQAAGSPDTTAYGDHATAWAPAQRDAGAEWLELTYDSPVIPTEIAIWETSGNGFVTSVEAHDAASGWVLLWQGTDDSPQEVHGFRPLLEATDVVTDRIRITIDTTVPDWNEVDAVELSGVAPETP